MILHFLGVVLLVTKRKTKTKTETKKDRKDFRWAIQFYCSASPLKSYHIITFVKYFYYSVIVLM